MRRYRLLLVLLVLAVGAVPLAGWLIWTESHPERERELRIATQDRLEMWFPRLMSPPVGLHGFVSRNEGPDRPPDIVLIHGLDEPGGIWDELVPALSGRGLSVWEFRYPNDQAIAHSTDLLSTYWETLDATRPVILIGHSMGGLIIRDFITRWRYPADGSAAIPGPPVAGAILVGTPSGGSDLARLRAWLELREWLAEVGEGRFSVWSGLHQGTGAAKIDLRPDSEFLRDLNQRTWPAEIPVQVIGGKVADPTPEMLESLDDLSSDLGIPDLRTRVEALLSATGGALGDGVVPISSLGFQGAPEPLIVPATHRGLLVRMPFADHEPAAIEPILQWLDSLQGRSSLETPAAGAQ